MEGAAHSLHLELQSVEVSRVEDLDRAFSAVTNQRAQAASSALKSGSLAA